LNNTIKLFRVAGLDIRMHVSWLIIATLVTFSLATGFFPYSSPGYSTFAYWLMAAVAALGLFGSITLHEMGHALVARKHGIAMEGIVLFIFGGVAQMKEEPANAKSEFQMAIAGPLVSFALAVVFYAFAQSAALLNLNEPVTATFAYLSLINGLLGIFNLAPALPMDGGRVLRAFLWQKRNDIHSATRTAARWGVAFSYVLMILGLVNIVAGNLIGGVWWVLIGMFLKGLAVSTRHQMEIRSILKGEPVSKLMRSDVVSAPPSISLRRFVAQYIYGARQTLFPVVENGRLAGFAGVEDVKTIVPSEWDKRTVGEILQE